MLRILSLGAGVQSTTLALMAAKEEIPPFDAAIFADTQSEPAAVYTHLAKLMAPGVLPFPVHVVTKGSLRQEILDACAGRPGVWARPPLFVLNADGSPGMTRRQCTADYKLDMIFRHVRVLAGIKARARPKGVLVEQAIGISLDEVIRMKDAAFPWLRHAYPLIDLGMNRQDCEKKLAAWGWAPTKSACTFCPYHDDRTWAEMKAHDPVSWADAVRVDEALRTGAPGIRGRAFLHEARIPLADVDFQQRLARPRRKRQLRLYLSGGFGNECEGMCGV